MTQETREEKKNKRVAMATSIGVHGLLLLILMFAVAWRAPDPPLPEYGIQLNFGVDDQGSGDVQPETPPASTEEVQPQPQEQSQQLQQEQQPATVSQNQPDKDEDIVPVQSNVESPVDTKEEKKPQQQEPQVQQKEQKPVAKEQTQKETLPAVTYPKKTDDKGTVSQGDATNKTGDQGSDQGQLDANALYGKPGGGQGGSSLDLANWDWDEIPHPNVPDNEMGGRIVFEIQVDANGDLRGYRKIEGAVGPETEKACRAAIEKLTFSKKAGAVVPAMSTGRITFVITSK